MKHTILILAILAMAGVGYANEDESSLTFISGGPVYIGDIPAGTGVDVELLDEAYTLPFDNREIDAPEWMKVAPESWKHETLNTTQIIDLLTRCKEFLRDRDMRQTVHTTLEYRPLTRKGVIEGEIKSYQEELERLERETQLLRDIEAALKALQ